MNIKEYYKAQFVKSLFLMENQDQEDEALRNELEWIPDQINQRRSISNASGVDAEGGGYLKASPFDVKGQSPSQYAKNLEKFDTTMRRKFTDPLNLLNMGFAASAVDSLNKGENTYKAKTGEEHEKDDFDRMKEIQDRLRSKESSQSIA